MRTAKVLAQIAALPTPEYDLVVKLGNYAVLTSYAYNDYMLFKETDKEDKSNCAKVGRKYYEFISPYTDELGWILMETTDIVFSIG